MIITGQIVNIEERKIFPGKITIEAGKIQAVEEIKKAPDHYIIPGFIDAHIHIESSMLVPSEFARIAVKHGTVATVSDPHEIANVLGIPGVKFMIENGRQTPFKFNFGAPSCVPATAFETAGAVIDSKGIRELLEMPEIRYLAEMMNYPGVIFDDEEVHKKLAIAKELQKPVDGHAPGLRGEDLTKYINAGINTDHESFSYEEGLEKLKKGMKILVREGSAAKNFEALVDLLPDHYENMMFCSDDKHPDDLLIGHINTLCARAVEKGVDLFKILQVACLNPIEHYKLEVGRLRPGDAADLCVIKDLERFEVIKTLIDGEIVFENGRSLIGQNPIIIQNNFSTSPKKPADFEIQSDARHIRVIEAVDGELITNAVEKAALTSNGKLLSNPEQDVLKMTVVSRYNDQKPAIAFISNFGLKSGAIASSVGHDSHNIISVGVSDEAICQAVNLLIMNKGGICAVSESEEMVLPLPVAGIMSDKDAEYVGNAYARIDQLAKQLGSKLRAPYMTLSFMALLVIPSLKLSDLGLFDGSRFEFTSLKID